jgi:2-deoxy-D-gluconate 3-dehydrogenase
MLFFFMLNTSAKQLIDLSSKTALVTGGAMGIGLGIVNRLAEAGANVVIADINQEAGEAAVSDLNSRSFKTAFVKADVSVENEVVAAVDFAMKTFGGLDILVNNAGIYPMSSILSMSLADFDRVLSVNLNSVFLFTKAAGAMMIKQGRGGRIINISSIDALYPSMIGLSAYDSSKHAVIGLTRSAALELAAANIMVNEVAPGMIATPGTGMVPGKEIPPQLQAVIDKTVLRIPMKRIGDPDDIGRAVLFLASDLSSYITGSQIIVDGGYLLS